MQGSDDEVSVYASDVYGSPSPSDVDEEEFLPDSDASDGSSVIAISEHYD